MSTPSAGDPVRASDIKIPRYISKSGTETVTSSTTLQNDNDFVIPLTPGVYGIQLWLHTSGHATGGDIRTAWATTGTITAVGRSVWGMAEGGTSETSTQIRVGGHNIGTEVVCGVVAATTVVREEMIVICTVAGTLTFQWAQGTSNGTGTSLSVASRCIITELEDF